MFSLSTRIITTHSKQNLIQKYKLISSIKNILYNKIKTRLYEIFISCMKQSSHKSKYKTLFPNKSTTTIVRKQKHSSPNTKSSNKKYLTIESYNNDLEQCTFTPKINKYYKPITRSNKLYRSNSYYKQLYNKNNKNQVVTEQCNDVSFKNNNSSFMKEYNFYSNQMNHVERVKDKIFNLKLQKLNSLENKCTFTPQINSNYQSKNYTLNNSSNNNYNEYEIQPNETPLVNEPRYIKLNNDAKRKIENLKQLQIKLDKENEEKNPKLPRNLNYSSDCNSCVRCNSHNNIFHSKGYFNKLYNDAIDIKNKRTELEQEVLNEVTFKPNLFNENNNKYKVKTDFKERNEQLIKNKNNRIKLKEDKEKEELKHFSKNKVSKVQSEKIKNEVVERLYDKEIQKKKKEEKESNGNNKKVNKNYSNIKSKKQKEEPKELIDKIKSDHIISFKHKPNQEKQSDEMTSPKMSMTMFQIKSLSDSSPLVSDLTSNPNTKDKREFKEEIIIEEQINVNTNHNENTNQCEENYQSQSMKNLLTKNNSTYTGRNEIKK